jgi:oxygen-dependent protoporphyrinogen oxidase
MTASPRQATRIAIVGAGPSGLYAAQALRELGYTHITVLERQARVGGMALTRHHEAGDGRRIPYEMGSAQPFSSRRLFRLIRELNLHLGVDFGDGERLGKLGRFRFYNTRRADYVADFVRFPHTGQPLNKQLGLIRDFARLVPTLIRFRYLMQPGHAGCLPPEVAGQSEAQWMKAQGFEVIQPLLQALFSATASGGACEKPDDPRSLVQSLKSLVFAINPPMRYTKGLFQPVREGYQEILVRLAQRFNVITQADITQIQRSPDGVKITWNGQTQSFDRLIIACPPANLMPALDATDEEQSVFSRILTRPTWRVCFLARGIPEPTAAYVFTDQAEYPDATPALCGFSCHGLVEGSGQDALRLYCGLVGLDQMEGIDAALETSTQRLQKVFGAHDIRWIDKVFWRQFNSHFPLEDVAAGVYQQVERMQGQHATYYTGEYLAGNSHSMTLEYSWALAQRHFETATVRAQRPADTVAS